MLSSWDFLAVAAGECQTAALEIGHTGAAGKSF
jgi:hypothetical protein